jgi:thiamine-monophosphate kinase
MLVGVGDDAAVVEPERNRVEVLTVDALIEGIHFDRAFVPPDAIGYRALAVNLSDIAAMGAAPKLALLSMALPSEFPLADFDRLVDGVVACAEAFRVQIAGGNLTRSPGPLMIDVTVTGSVKRRQTLTRGGARPGDEIYVSGTIGGAAAGLEMLRTGANDGSSCIARYLRPDPRVRLGTQLARNRAATACMDLSDGLADAVHQLAGASGVGAIIDADALPIDVMACQWYTARRADPIEAAVTAGDDYELLATVRPRANRRVQQIAAVARTQFTRIGRCTDDRAVVLRRNQSGKAVDVPLPQPGFRHFQ